MQKRVDKHEEVAKQADSVQSMINYLKQNPHKFDRRITNKFLEEKGLNIEFEEIAQQYMADWQTKVDLTSVNTFVSETNVIDISNRSLLKSIDKSSRKIQVKRATDVNTMLLCLDDNLPQPSKHSKQHKTHFKSCPRIRVDLKKWPDTIEQEHKRRHNSMALNPTRYGSLLSSRLCASIKPLDLLYINEITQASSYQNILFKNNFK